MEAKINGVISLIVMPRKTPERLTFYEVMMRRSLKRDDYSELYKIAKAGYDGELRLDREWKDIRAPGMLFHDFTFYNSATHSHQIDTIYVCKHFVLVIETKNLAGKIDFNPNTRQLIQSFNNGQSRAYNDPVDQVERHRNFLERHFMLLPELIPVETAIIFTNSKCYIGQTSDDISIFVVTGLRAKLNELTKRHQHVNLNTRLIKSTLEKLYKPISFQKSLDIDSLKYGVLCLYCNEKMIPTNNNFKCLVCNCYDTEHAAIRRTLYDYRVLFSSEITNEQFRNFAEISSRDTAYGILSRLLPTKIGSKRHTKYVIPENIYTSQSYK